MEPENEIDVQQILDDAARDITKRLAGIELERAQWPQGDSSDIASLYTATTGSYSITVVYHAETRLLRYIAEKMKRRPIEDAEEVEMYAKEYFNILCGHIISKINRLTKASARFGVPNYRRGFYTAEDYPGIVLKVSYRSSAGGLQLQSCCNDMEQIDDKRQNEAKGSSYE